MRHKDLRTGVVYAWSPTAGSARKCAFADLETVRVSSRPRERSSEPITIRSPRSYETYWGRHPSCTYGARDRRGFLAVTGDENADDAALIERATELASKLDEYGERFEVPRTTDLEVIGPREVYGTWKRLQIARHEEEERRNRETQLRRAQVDAAAEVHERIRTALGGQNPPMPRVGELGYCDRLELSAAWLADLLDVKQYEADQQTAGQPDNVAELVAHDAQVNILAPRVGDRIDTVDALAALPEGAILQSASDDGWDALAYRVTTFEWSVTGHNRCVPSGQLSQFATAWTVVRIRA